MVGWKGYEWVSRLRGCREAATTENNAGIIQPAGPPGLVKPRALRSAGFGGKENCPLARYLSSWIAFGRGRTRRREYIVILMATSSIFKAERNWTATS